MKLREQLEALKGLPETMLNANVVLQEDPEGNGYKHLRIVDSDGVCLDPDAWQLEIYSAEWSAEDADMESETWEEHLAKPHCIVLSPQKDELKVK